MGNKLVEPPSSIPAQAINNFCEFVVRLMSPGMSLSENHVHVRSLARSVCKHRPRITIRRVWDAELMDWFPIIDKPSHSPANVLDGRFSSTRVDRFFKSGI